jgi:hypothetical protein
MRSKIAACAAATVFALATAGPAAQSPTTTTGTPGATSSNAKSKEVALIGCLEPEKDYRARLDAKKGGPLGSGLGQGNEFVLTSARTAPANGSNKTAGEAVATAGLSGDYMLTGKVEDALKKSVNREVEVIGVVEPFRANTNATEDRDRLPHFEVSRWHPAGDYCPAKPPAH